MSDNILASLNCINVIQISDTASFEHLNFATQIYDEAASVFKAKTVSYSCGWEILRNINLPQKITDVGIRRLQAPIVERTQYLILPTLRTIEESRYVVSRCKYSVIIFA